MQKRIKLFDPHKGKKEESSIRKVLKSGFWSSGSGIGKVLEFEKKFQKYLGNKSCVAVNSGTAALHLALSHANIRKKEVILPSMSFVSTAHAILYNGGIPIFSDIDPNTLCIDPEELSKKISNKTRVVLPVHFGGMPCDLKKIKKLTHSHNLILIEDAAHACGSIFNGKKIGLHGDFVCFSFHPVKNLAMPSGGIIALNTNNHKQLREKLVAQRWCGITNRKDVYYDVKELGWNFYMNDFAAAIGIIQLEKLDNLNNKRKKIAEKYFKKINLESKMPFNENCVYHLYWVLVKNRDDFRKKMLKAGVETGIHYKPIHQFSLYKGQNKLPVTEKISKEIVSLPIHPNLSESDVDRIINCVNKFS